MEVATVVLNLERTGQAPGRQGKHEQTDNDNRKSISTWLKSGEFVCSEVGVLSKQPIVTSAREQNEKKCVSQLGEGSNLVSVISAAISSNDWCDTETRRSLSKTSFATPC